MRNYFNPGNLLAILIIWGVMAAPVSGSDGMPFSEIKVIRNRSVVLKRDKPVIRVSVVKPEIADVNLLNSRQIQLIGIAPGTTQLILWHDDDHCETLDIRVNAGFDVEVIFGTGLDPDCSLRGW